MDIFKDAVEDSAAKLTKSFEKILIEVIILFMVIPRTVSYTHLLLLLGMGIATLERFQDLPSGAVKIAHVSSL